MERTLTQLPFWSSLTEQEQETLRRSAFVRHYEKGAFVHSSDNECLGMLLILSGEIRTYLLSDEGREVTLFRLYPGELCVLSASCVISQITFDTQMTAGMDTDVLIIPAIVIAALKEKNLHVRCFLYELATKRFSDVMSGDAADYVQGIGSAAGRISSCRSGAYRLRHDTHDP